MSSKKKKIKAGNQKRRLEEAAALYTEDIGSTGIKKSSLSAAHGYHESISRLPLADDEEYRRKKRMQRFGSDDRLKEDGPNALSSALTSSRVYEGVKGKKKRKSHQSILVGTSTALEKPYLRLTEFPKAEDVRPLTILVKALAAVKSKYIKNEDFEWTNEQLKGIRQDMTVQHIRNKFVLEVYETHARLLLEHGNLNEFHQCQTMIRSLTVSQSIIQGLEKGTENDVNEKTIIEFIQGESVCLHQSEDIADEFYAYGLLYNLAQNSWGEMTLMLSSSNGSSCSETESSAGDIPAAFRGSSVKHAVKVVKAVMHDDYQSFFRLYECAPHLSAYLMDFLVRRVRNNAYNRIVAAYRPSLSVEHFREALFFQDLEETRRFLKKNRAKFIHELGAPPFWVDCKATFLSTSQPVNKI